MIGTAVKFHVAQDEKCSQKGGIDDTISNTFIYI